MSLQTRFLGTFGTSCRSVAPVAPARLCRGPSPPLNGPFHRKQHFSSVIFIFRQVFLSEHFYLSQRFLCTNPPSDTAPSAKAGKCLWVNLERHTWALLPEPLTCVAAGQGSPARDSAVSSSHTERVNLVHIYSFQETEHIDISGGYYAHRYLTIMCIHMYVFAFAEFQKYDTLLTKSYYPIIYLKDFSLCLDLSQLMFFLSVSG